MATIESTIRSLLPGAGRNHEIGDDDDLLTDGLLDSVGVLSLVSGLEQAFDVQIEMEHVTEENFRTVRDIAALVQRLAPGTDRA